MNNEVNELNAEQETARAKAEAQVTFVFILSHSLIYVCIVGCSLFVPSIKLYPF